MLGKVSIVSYCIFLLKKRLMFSCNWTYVQKMLSDCVLRVGVNLWSLKDKLPYYSACTCNIGTWTLTSRDNTLWIDVGTLGRSVSVILRVHVPTEMTHTLSLNRTVMGLIYPKYTLLNVPFHNFWFYFTIFIVWFLNHR